MGLNMEDKSIPTEEIIFISGFTTTTTSTTSTTTELPPSPPSPL
jgi:hypothetical protein